jgi:hypothetical protein
MMAAAVRSWRKVEVTTSAVVSCTGTKVGIAATVGNVSVAMSDEVAVGDETAVGDAPTDGVPARSARGGGEALVVSVGERASAPLLGATYLKPIPAKAPARVGAARALV